MVDVKTGEAIKQYSQGEGIIHNVWLVEVEDDEIYLFQSGVRKVKEVYLCGYCEEGFHLKKEDAEKCCLGEE